jgi:hypothetical protein
LGQLGSLQADQDEAVAEHPALQAAVTQKKRAIQDHQKEIDQAHVSCLMTLLMIATVDGRHKGQDANEHKHHLL